MIGRDALQPTDRDGLAIDASASARGLAGPIARSAEDTWKDVRLAIEEI
jgi:hypothetical protein